jgi:hypothetical protein
MNTATIGRPAATTVSSPAREFWQHAAEAHGRTLDAASLDTIEHLSDIEILRRWFGDLSDPEQQELLWAYGGFRSDRHHGPAASVTGNSRGPRYSSMPAA